MQFSDSINEVKNKEDLVRFLDMLKEDKEKNNDEWENQDIESYLDGIASWIEDMEGYYKNLKKEEPQNIDWSFIATLFYVGKIYE